ncbi:MAG: long-chain fatty acid--CoA ligase [Porticoccaceae bacterium]
MIVFKERQPVNGGDVTDFEPKVLSTWLARRAEFSGNAPALTFGDRRWTYAQLVNDADRLAAVFSEKGVKQGDRIAFLGFHCPEVLLSLFACSKLGAIFVPLNFRLSAAELKPIIADCGAHTLVVDSQHTEILAAMVGDLDCQCYLQTDVAEGQAGAWPLLTTLLNTVSGTAPSVAVNSDDIAAIVYTSGTTGIPKGVMLSHGNLWANNLNWNLAAGISSEDVILVTAPPFHVSGLFVLLTSVLLMGGHVVLHRGFDTDNAIAAIENHGITITFMVPSMILMLSQHEHFPRANLSSLRLFVVGGAPTPEPVLRLCNDRGIPVSHCYGMSECSSATTFLDPKLATEKLNSVGLAMLLSQIKIVDDQGRNITEPDVKGEICVRGGNVTSGYWSRAQATEELFLDGGWCRSGDIGYLDSEGYLYLSDRIKDMIISGGENIYPAEVESVLMAHPAIANVAVVGRPDDHWGERAVAVIILKPAKSLTLEQMTEFCHNRLARYKVPKELHIVAEFPLNGAGKVLKKQIRESLLSTE